MISCRFIRKSCVCRLCKHNYISARGSHGKGSAFETTTTTEFNAYIRAETSILGSAHTNTDIIFRFPQHNTVSFAAVLRQGLQRRVAGRMPVYGEALRKVPRKSGFRKGHSGCRSIFGLFTTIISYGGRCVTCRRSLFIQPFLDGLVGIMPLHGTHYRRNVGIPPSFRCNRVLPIQQIVLLHCQGIGLLLFLQTHYVQSALFIFIKAVNCLTNIVV